LKVLHHLAEIVDVGRERDFLKPCVRISRTRLARWASGRGVHHPMLNRGAQADETQGFEEGAAAVGAIAKAAT
jgi:hypothetical protein